MTLEFPIQKKQNKSFELKRMKKSMVTNLPEMMNELRAIIVRAATMEDVVPISEFNQLLAWETEKIRLKPNVIRSGVLAMLSDPAKGRYFVATVAGRVVGQIMHTYEWSDWRNGFLWWIQSVFVHQEFRGRGVFRALFEHLKQEAILNHGVGLRLYVEKENRTAQEVYRKLGMLQGGYHVLELPLVDRFEER